ncbi:MAG: bifunctional UDP-N-acetylglucosamine diphosphorylase/glucosamine-1-phosphate N-acetyltransferase GlmU [Deltaproteobacteria bacterium]|nr:bifunctional UDP-N-acetylglucosamine diphosphorylase/glucosamine-1-phosphate N-acetyltransferase GlmU [Deltaproteobacteria bacterium]
MRQYGAVVLAAGKGTRMKSNYCKVLHPVAGKPMLGYVLDAARGLDLDKICVVVGHQAEEVMRRFEASDVKFILQEPQLGTGHAVKQCSGLFEKFDGHILILCGDTPLITTEILSDLVRFHEDNSSRVTVLTTTLQVPFGYGRIIRDNNDCVSRIVEDRDASDPEKSINEINTGIYIIESNLLFDLLDKLRADNAQNEYYLTDVVSGANKLNVPVCGCHTADSSVVVGVNSRGDLADVNAMMWWRLRRQLMSDGVTLLDPNSFYPDFGITVGPDTVIYPNVMITGASSIGEDCVIDPSCLINDSKIGNRVKILLGSKLDKVEVEDDASIGPMAHLRPNAKIGRNARIGNFVEVKNTIVGAGTKAAHLTYLGDSQIGRDVNIGCGTITCNYDGEKKHRTIIEDRCFVGSDVQFVAPVRIGSGSVIGAGSTITKDVPPDSLAVARSKQKVFPLRLGQGSDSKNEDR